MSGKFNEPRLMGNCEHCYYATDTGEREKDGRRRFECHRLPATMWVREGDYCGEFAWMNEASLVRDAAK